MVTRQDNGPREEAVVKADSLPRAEADDLRPCKAVEAHDTKTSGPCQFPSELTYTAVQDWYDDWHPHLEASRADFEERVSKFRAFLVGDYPEVKAPESRNLGHVESGRNQQSTDCPGNEAEVVPSEKTPASRSKSPIGEFLSDLVGVAKRSHRRPQ